MTHTEILQHIYNDVMAEALAQDCQSKLPSEVVEMIEKVVSRSESNKGLITVLVTLFSHKIFCPEQDIRYHQAQLESGFAGRSIDKDEVTPFMKSVRFPAMAESGWLTRSLEQAHPYTLDYPGKITPAFVKSAFLQLIDHVRRRKMS